MKKLILIFIISCPAFLFAQKGVIIPDEKKQSTNSVISNGTKTWIMESYLVNCLDDKAKCYLIKENGINKTVLQDDVYDFVFEDGYKYTLLVNEELKAPPVDVSSGIYNYIVTKIISRKQINDGISDIPTVTNNSVNSIASEIPTTDKKTVYISPPTETPELFDEIQILKKQIKELKKQVDVMQLQLDMQFQLFLKK